MATLAIKPEVSVASLGFELWTVKNREFKHLYRSTLVAPSSIVDLCDESGSDYRGDTSKMFATPTVYSGARRGRH